MSLINPQSVPVTGVGAIYAAAAAGGDTITPAAGLVLHVKNASAAEITATLVRPGTQYGQPNPSVPISVPASGERFVRVPPEFADTDGLIDVTYSAVASVTVAVLQVQ